VSIEYKLCPPSHFFSIDFDIGTCNCPGMPIVFIGRMVPCSGNQSVILRCTHFVCFSAVIVNISDAFHLSRSAVGSMLRSFFLCLIRFINKSKEKLSWTIFSRRLRDP